MRTAERDRAAIFYQKRSGSDDVLLYKEKTESEEHASFKAYRNLEADLLSNRMRRYRPAICIGRYFQYSGPEFPVLNLRRSGCLLMDFGTSLVGILILRGYAAAVATAPGLSRLSFMQVPTAA